MELKDALNIYHHICDTFVGDCSGCPFSEADISCNPFDNYDSNSKLDEKEIAEWERVATEWWEHNKPIYPTFSELFGHILNEANEHFDWPSSIWERLNKQIPEHIAKEYNIMPINEGGLVKYERGEWHRGC